MEQVKEVLKRAFSIHGDVASYQEIHDRIISGGEVKGTNLCILVLAIFIASVGLNMNSTAVIIGAMLISPLMGGIMAIAYGIATDDFRQARNSCVGLALQIIVCLGISTLYFLLSPVKTPSDELLARTSPTVYDVIIACCGGLAGIIGSTRKEKSNVIPGVAIATALMPPLCTAGYGIAHGNLNYFLGAMYLFLINTYFICFTSVVILLILKVPKRSIVAISDEKWRKLKRKVIRNTIILVIPSVIFEYRMVHQEMENITQSYQSSIGNVSVEKINRELELVFPQIEEVKIGYLFEYEEKKRNVTENLSAIIMLKEPLTENQKNHIAKWLKIEGNITKIQYIQKEDIQ